MCNEIVAVVDDGIVIARTIVTVLVANVKQCDVAQVAASNVGHVNQVAANLAEQNGAVSNGLQFVDNASDTIHRVGRMVQVLRFGEDNLFRALIEEVRAGRKATGDTDGAKEYFDTFHNHFIIRG